MKKALESLIIFSLALGAFVAVFYMGTRSPKVRVIPGSVVFQVQTPLTPTETRNIKRHPRKMLGRRVKRQVVQQVQPGLWVGGEK